MHRAVPLPEDHARSLELLERVPAERAERESVVPDGHLVEADALLQARVAAKVLVREEEQLRAVFEGPVVDLRRVRGGADDTAVAPAKRLQRSRRVHISHRNYACPEPGASRAAAGLRRCARSTQPRRAPSTPPGCPSARN